ncbi:uncharacterized protein BDZ83DRAFT_784906 [Colletotrichum acutatum]|uniref:Uncharacterized protein n=1 Tax=Glomerella acutata TaxID=27357 RepID=A0AAD8UK11_GLOAC|nr:uncharacterized protein BDZ83DRAFT_784906 [Colletotrichum acutatum]KAK1720444.1 hypothetical protein BDZ83DRAFT_784906 [Colletotrichum acutatum]
MDMKHAHAGPGPRISLFLSKAPGSKATNGALQRRPLHLNTPCQINVRSHPQEEEEEENFSVVLHLSGTKQNYQSHSLSCEAHSDWLPVSSVRHLPFGDGNKATLKGRTLTKVYPPMFHALVHVCVFDHETHSTDFATSSVRQDCLSSARPQTTAGVCDVNRKAGNYWDPQLPIFGDFWVSIRSLTAGSLWFNVGNVIPTLMRIHRTATNPLGLSLQDPLEVDSVVGAWMPSLFVSCAAVSE